ncbi:PLP-dependent cysteine synthase family protein [Streptomyces ipomoeae]|uniref:PLP-dependent cysteine synthase family protein n=1 Tax=Streptomyces ipomoeae TaxID=103232 RepID=UPI001146C04D|nr:cysteine synthase family protein [Streptomyces ipomoeae]MDX2933548.1 cysteine synthase family protein [Streptomyces ipomoeae]TQE22250.1 cysteine synthase family protein [Streptomyces ipomoeae]
MIHESLLETLGMTPVVRLRKLLPRPQDRIYVKLEGANPSGSIKDRAALYMVEQAERAGLLRPGATLVESTSGNLGKSLALIGAVKGYRVILVVDPKTPQSVLAYATSLGAELDTVARPDANGSYQTARIRRVRQLVREIPGAYTLDQYDNPHNPEAHRLHTAQEIVKDFDRLSALVATVSTGGHLSGLSAALKERFPALHVRAVDAAGSAAFGHPFEPYRMRGIGLSWRPGNLDRGPVDSLHRVTDTEALSVCRVLAAEEGLLLGESGGAAVFAALGYAAAHPGEPVLAIAPDTGANYLYETYDDQWLRDHGTPLEALWRTRDDLLRHARHPLHPPAAVAADFGPAAGSGQVVTGGRA